MLAEILDSEGFAMSEFVSLDGFRHRGIAGRKRKSAGYRISALRICLWMLAVVAMMFAFEFIADRVDFGVMEFRHFIVRQLQWLV